MKANIIKFLYQHVLKPIFFKIDPEIVHDHMTFMGIILGNFWLTRALTRWAFAYNDKILQQDLLGIHFVNPIGLSAGFDKNARMTEIVPQVGFGFSEVGSITGEPCEGNEVRPRLWRLIKSKSIVVYYGLKNDGAEIIAKRLRNKKFSIPIGISVAKTNCALTADTNAGIQDYVKAYQAFAPIGSYYTLNISCPNAFGGQPFTDPERLDLLLKAIFAVPKSKPVFIKLSPDLSNQEVDSLLDVIARYAVDGLIIANLTKNKSNPKIVEQSFPENGGMSGKVVEELANNMIAYVYKKTKAKYIIVGCGGVFSAEDAYKKIKLGASLIQMITGMIFEGPQLVGEINRGLVKLLKEDGYQNISQAVGKLN